MPLRCSALLAAFLTVVAAACSRPTVKALTAEALGAMGGADKVAAIKTITMKDGAGTREQLLEARHVGEAEPPATLSKVTEIVDLANGRASMRYVIDNAGFMQDRHEVLTKRSDALVGLDYVGMRPVVATSVGGLFSWGTQNNPEILLRRNVIGILRDAADSTSAASDEAFAGRMAKHAHVTSKSGEDVGLYFDPQSKLLIGFETTDSEAMAGDVPAQYVLENYKAVDGVMLPHKITITKGGKSYSTVEYAGAAINDPGADKDFEIPEAASKQADEAIAAGVFSPVSLQKIADDVYFARVYSHNSLVVVFPEFLAVVEAPYTDAQSITLAGVLRRVSAQAGEIRGGHASAFGSHRRRSRHGGGGGHSARREEPRGAAAVAAQRPFHTPAGRARDASQRRRANRCDRALRGQEGDRSGEAEPRALRFHGIAARRADGAGVCAWRESAVPERPLVPRHGRRRHAGCKATPRVDSRVEAPAGDQRRRTRRRRAVCGAGEGRRGELKTTGRMNADSLADAGKQTTSPHTLPGREGLATTLSDTRQGATLAPGSFVCRIAAATKPFAFTFATNDVT